MVRAPYHEPEGWPPHGAPKTPRSALGGEPQGSPERESPWSAVGAPSEAKHGLISAKLFNMYVRSCTLYRPDCWGKRFLCMHEAVLSRGTTSRRSGPPQEPPPEISRRAPGGQKWICWRNCIESVRFCALYPPERWGKGFRCSHEAMRSWRYFFMRASLLA